MKSGDQTVYRRIKRSLDLLGGLVGLIITLPVMLAIAALVRINIGRSVLFLQERPGLNGRFFTCLKFRTMNDERDQNGVLLSDQQRVVPVGRFLRQTSLDELPQLWNIVRGDLSFIGPRPLLKEYLPYYNPEERRRHNVRPGLTGWAQIHGRNCLPFDERLALDIWYVDHLSWYLDFRILLATIWIVVTSKGTGAVSFPPLNEQRKSALPDCFTATKH